MDASVTITLKAMKLWSRTDILIQLSSELMDVAQHTDLVTLLSSE